MKNKLLVVLFVGIFALCVTGCGKKDDLKKVEVKGPRVVCTYKEEEDNITTEGTITLKFNSDNYVNYQLLENTLTFKDKDTFNTYADAMKDSDMDLGEYVEYDYSINKSKKKIHTNLIYKEGLFDYSKVTDEEEKAEYLASNIIKKYEDNKATCKYIETSKKDLGIEE